MNKYIVVDMTDVYAIVDRLEQNPDINTVDTEAVMSGLFSIINVKTEINKHIDSLNEFLLDHFYSCPTEADYVNDVMKTVSSDLFQALHSCYNSMLTHGLYLDNRLHYDYYKRHTKRKAVFRQPPK